MDFDTYIRTKGYKEEELASILDVSQGTVNRWRRGLRLPRPAAIHQIEQFTEGAVTLADWLRAPDQKRGAS